MGKGTQKDEEQMMICIDAHQLQGWLCGILIIISLLADVLIFKDAVKQHSIFLLLLSLVITLFSFVFITNFVYIIILGK